MMYLPSTYERRYQRMRSRRSGEKLRHEQCRDEEPVLRQPQNSRFSGDILANGLQSGIVESVWYSGFNPKLQ